MLKLPHLVEIPYEFRTGHFFRITGVFLFLKEQSIQNETSFKRYFPGKTTLDGNFFEHKLS